MYIYTLSKGNFELMEAWYDMGLWLQLLYGVKTSHKQDISLTGYRLVVTLALLVYSNKEIW